MGVPTRFVVEYPERCLKLLDRVECWARKERLVGSLALLVASAAFVIPYERIKAAHPMHKDEDDGLNEALRKLDKKEKFVNAPFWAGEAPGSWRYSRIMNNANDTSHWLDEDGKHPVGKDASNLIGKKTAGTVLRVIRNALAHGNVVYLSSDGLEEPGKDLKYLAFLSRYEETDEDKKRSETYRLVVASQHDFLAFVRAWANWIRSFDESRDTTLFEAA
jgi:hypothetical protein